MCGTSMHIQKVWCGYWTIKNLARDTMNRVVFPACKRFPHPLLSLKVPLDQDTSNVNLSWDDSQTCEEDWRRRVAFASGKKTTIYSRTLICKTHRSRFWIDHVTLSHMVLTRERSTKKVYTYIPIVRHKAAEDVSLLDRQVFQVSSLSCPFYTHLSMYQAACLLILQAIYLSNYLAI